MSSDESFRIKVRGMTCQHCVGAVGESPFGRYPVSPMWRSTSRGAQS